MLRRQFLGLLAMGSLNLPALLSKGVVGPDGQVRVTGADKSGSVDLSGYSYAYGPAQAVPASPQLTLPDGYSYLITGVDRIHTIEPKPDGTPIILRFEKDLCTVFDRHQTLPGPGNVYLGQGAYVSIVDGVLALYCDGGRWIELGRSNPPRLNLWYYPDVVQVVATATSTNVVWGKNGYFFFPKDPLGLLQDDPTNEGGGPWLSNCIRLPYLGIYDIFWGVTFDDPGVPVGKRGSSLSMYFKGGHPDGTSTDEWAATADANDQIAAAGGNDEATVVGAATVYSDGTNLVKIVCNHTQGGNVNLSNEAYETHIRISYRG